MHKFILNAFFLFASLNVKNHQSNDKRSLDTLTNKEMEKIYNQKRKRRHKGRRTFFLDLWVTGAFALYWLLLCVFITFIVCCSIALWRSAKPLRLAQKQGWILIKLSQIDTEQLNLIRPLVLIHTQRAFSTLILITDKVNS